MNSQEYVYILMGRFRSDHDDEIIRAYLSESAANAALAACTAYHATAPDATKIFFASHDEWQAAEDKWRAGHPAGSEIEADEFKVVSIPLIR